MTAIHHATAKRAANIGINLVVEGDDIVARDHDGLLLAQGIDAKRVLVAAEQARLERNGGPDDAEYNEPDQDEPEDDVADEGSDDNNEAADEPKVERSIVKRKYRKLYMPKNRSCGDEMAHLIAEHVKEDDVLNLDKLIRFAKANDCWIDSYRKLNPGQIRMNVGNRLRAKIRKGHDVIWAS